MWDRLISLQSDIEHIFDTNLERYDEPHLERFNHAGWINRTWKSDKFRRAHIDVVDARDTKKLWMMHVCVFPNTQSGAPIYGFDVISGPTKITGAFHDFSPVDPNHPAIKYFADVTSKYSWSKERALPDWAQAIFSNNMVAAGNIQSDIEVASIASLVVSNTKWYIEKMETRPDIVSVDAHNRYAYYQKQNPHTPRTMKALGLNEQDVDFFVNECLFPKVDK